jgi:uncharacterized membrane protein
MLEALVAAATFPFRPLRPIHAIFLAFPLPLFLAALVSDFAYWSTFQVQLTNFSSWLIAAGLVGGGFALICALIGLLSVQVAPDRKRIAYLIVLSVMWVLGFIDAFVHAKDAHATMPEGLLCLLSLGSWRSFPVGSDIPDFMREKRHGVGTS